MRPGNERVECAVLAPDESGLPREVEVFLPKRVGLEPCPIGFVVGQAIDAVDAVGERGRTLMRSEIADQPRPAAWDRLSLIAGVDREILGPGRIDLVADEAGDHHASPLVIPTKEVA